MAKQKITSGTGKKDQRYVTIPVKVKLRENELNEKGEELGKLDLKINEEKKSASDAAKSARESIKLLVEARDKLAVIVSTGEEERMTKCREDADFDHGTIITVNQKTGDKISERAMEAHERERMSQGMMPWFDQEDVELPEKAKNDVESGPVKKSKGNGEHPPAEA